MSFGRGRKDLEGLTSSYALEEEQRRANAEAARRREPMGEPIEGEGGDGTGGPGSVGGVMAWIRRAFRR